MQKSTDQDQCFSIMVAHLEALDMVQLGREGWVHQHHQDPAPGHLYQARDQDLEPLDHLSQVHDQDLALDHLCQVRDQGLALDRLC